MEHFRWVSTSLGSGGAVDCGGGDEGGGLPTEEAPSSLPAGTLLDRMKAALDLCPAAAAAAALAGGMECLVFRRLYSDTMLWMVFSVTTVYTRSGSSVRSSDGGSAAGSDDESESELEGRWPLGEPPPTPSLLGGYKRRWRPSNLKRKQKMRLFFPFV